MKIPEKIKISGYNYTVERPQESFVDGLSVCDGIHDINNLLIKVARRGCPDYQNTVFLHEVVHGIIHNYCSGILSDYDEERFTEQFAKGLYQVLSDNPDIFR